tara:strand:- start:11 stop:277 length:267 start_codon:yes stop_codon:yes gene_type:complete
MSDHINKIRTNEEIQNRLDTMYENESELVISLLSQSITKFNINTFYKLDVAYESLSSLNDFPEYEGFGSSDRYYAFKGVEEFLKTARN